MELLLKPTPQANSPPPEHRNDFNAALRTRTRLILKVANEESKDKYTQQLQLIDIIGRTIEKMHSSSKYMPFSQKKTKAHTLKD